MQNFEAKCKGLKALVVGDSALDYNGSVKVTGESREVPGMPVHSIMESTQNPGGAANLAANLTKLGVETTLVSIWGPATDLWRASFEYSLLEHKIKAAMLEVRSAVYGKYYYAGSNHHFIQLNIPFATPDKVGTDELVDLIKSQEPDFAIVLDQYEVGPVGGVFNSPLVYSAVLSLKVPTYVSSRRCIGNFPNADSYVGNEDEIERAVTLCCRNDPKDLLRTIGGLYLILTRGGKGCHVYRPNSSGEYIPTKEAVERINICGCGDTFLAAFALADMQGGFPLKESAKIAAAAARYTAKQLEGTGYPTFADIEKEYEEIYGGN